MYRCGISGKNSLPGQKAERVVTKRRPKQYWGERENKETKKMETVLLSEGWEIVEELIVLPDVAIEFNQGLVNVKEQNAQKNKTFAGRIKKASSRD